MVIGGTEARVIVKNCCGRCDNITMVLANFRVIKTVDLIQLHLNTSSLGLRLSYLNKTLIITSS
jgi:hypothetical protein